MDFELVELEGSICANLLSLCIVYIYLFCAWAAWFCV